VKKLERKQVIGYRSNVRLLLVSLTILLHVRHKEPIFQYLSNTSEDFDVSRLPTRLPKHDDVKQYMNGELRGTLHATRPYIRRQSACKTSGEE